MKRTGIYLFLTTFLINSDENIKNPFKYQNAHKKKFPALISCIYTFPHIVPYCHAIFINNNKQTSLKWYKRGNRANLVGEPAYSATSIMLNRSKYLSKGYKPNQRHSSKSKLVAQEGRKKKNESLYDYITCIQIMFRLRRMSSSHINLLR